jgi:uncharacterized membrane protein YgcG
MRIFVSLILITSYLSVFATVSCDRRPPSGFQSKQSSPDATAEQTPCLLPVPDTYVSDYANVLDHQDAKDELEHKLRKLKSRGNIDFVVVLIKSTGGQDIFDYSLALARCWNIGNQNPDKAGLLLLVAVKDRKWHIQITRVLERILTNDEVYRIGNLMTPDFRESRYGAGVNKSVDAMIEALASRRGFSISKTSQRISPKNLDWEPTGYIGSCCRSRDLGFAGKWPL